MTSRAWELDLEIEKSVLLFLMGGAGIVGFALPGFGLSALLYFIMRGFDAPKKGSFRISVVIFLFICGGSIVGREIRKHEILRTEEMQVNSLGSNSTLLPLPLNCDVFGSTSKYACKKDRGLRFPTKIGQ